MKQYLDLVQTVLTQGKWRQNRTGIRACKLPGASMRFDLTKGFPAITTRKLAFKAAVGELIGFIRGFDSAAQFRELNCKVWDQNANENAQWLANPFRDGTDDLGPVYGVQWREWPAYKLIRTSEAASAARREAVIASGYKKLGEMRTGGLEVTEVFYKAIDQLKTCLDTIVKNPDDRRILFHGWNCSQLDEMALPPCHLLYHFLPDAQDKELSMCVYVRSNDLGLGAPFNMCEAAVLMHLVGRLTGYTPKWLTYYIGDAHVYENHLDMLKTQMMREPKALPNLVISERVPDFAKTGIYQPEWLEKIEPSDITLENYEYHPALTAPMAV